MAKTSNRTQKDTMAKSSDRDEEKFRSTKFPIKDDTMWCVECHTVPAMKGCIQCEFCIHDRVEPHPDPDNEFLEGEFDLDDETIDSPSFSD